MPKIEHKPDNKTYILVVMSILSAIIILQNFVNFLGYIPIPPISPTIIHITCIVGAVYFGSTKGAVLGFVWGVACIIRAVVAPPDPLAPILFVNPLVSVLPRVLVGFAAGALFALLRKLKVPKMASFAISGGVGSFINSFCVLGAIYLLYKVPFANAYNKPVEELIPIIMGIIGTSGLAEAALAVVLVPIIAGALDKVKKID